MTNKDEALRLADMPFALRAGMWHTQADHVLLNLHADNKQLQAQRNELLEALKLALRQNEHDMVMTGEECRQCRAAITKAEDGK